jgi:hypothetical protein
MKRDLVRVTHSSSTGAPPTSDLAECGDLAEITLELRQLREGTRSSSDVQRGMAQFFT